MANDTIEVGKVRDEGRNGWIFIGASDGAYERCTRPFSGAVHTISFSRKDAQWLIGALRKELAYDEEAEPEDYIDDV